MAEDFTTYTEEDTNSRITVTSTRVTQTEMLAGDDKHYVYIDKGVDAISGNFTHLLTVKITASERGGATSLFWAMTNDLDDFQGLRGSSKSGIFLYVDHPQTPNITRFSFYELDGGSLAGPDTYTLTKGTAYYLKIVRDESVGNHGTAYCYIYSDAARTTLLDTLTVTLNTSKKDFRYVFPCMSADETAATTKKMSGYSENLTLEESSGPTVTTEAVDDIDVTTATGHGTITSLGSAAVTQHGHCWNTSTNPTTANSKTSKGTGSEGPFISSMTSLSSNTLYYVRAYATNSLGTSYGTNVTFTTATTDMPVVETRDCDELTGTTARGVGIIWSVGGSEVTEHGHCWNTSINPTTGNTKTTKGFGYYGAFTSAITGLTATTSYYIRAYATNTAGTAYGNNVRIIPGVGGNELAGPIAVVQTRLHYVDKYGVERYVEGTAI